MSHGMTDQTENGSWNATSHGLPYSPSPYSNPLESSFSSIVKAVEGDKRMGDFVALSRGVR